MTTPWQTIGPFFGFALPWDDGPHAVPPGTPGLVTVFGRITDGAGEAVPDALVETWQADTDGRFAHAADPRGSAPDRPAGARWFDGETVANPRDPDRPAGARWFARCPTDPRGRFAIHTLKPGPVPTADGIAAPHLAVTVLARGLLRRLVTRVYFPDEPDANAADPVLSALTDPRRRSGLIAEPTPDGLRFDIRLRGMDETVFFDV